MKKLTENTNGFVAFFSLRTKCSEKYRAKIEKKDVKNGNAKFIDSRYNKVKKKRKDEVGMKERRTGETGLQLASVLEVPAFDVPAAGHGVDRDVHQ